MTQKMLQARKSVLANNIIKYLEANGMNERTAANLAGIKPTTLNSWTREISYPRLANLEKLALLFHIEIADLTEENIHSERRPGYLKVGASETLRHYNNSKEFQQWCELGLELAKKGYLLSYLKRIREQQ